MSQHRSSLLKGTHTQTHSTDHQLHLPKGLQKSSFLLGPWAPHWVPFLPRSLIEESYWLSKSKKICHQSYWSQPEQTTLVLPRQSCLNSRDKPIIVEVLEAKWFIHLLTRVYFLMIENFLLGCYRIRLHTQRESLFHLLLLWTLIRVEFKNCKYNLIQPLRLKGNVRS